MNSKRIVLAVRPKGLPSKDTFREETFELQPLIDGQVVVESMYISVDPYMRGRLNDQKSYVAPYEIGTAITGGVIGRIIESKSVKYQVGDIVLAGYGWQTHSVEMDEQVRLIDPSIAPVTTALGVLGMTGLTAYFGLLDIGKPQKGETIVVSAAAGAVGMIVGQIAKIHGAHVVGIAGSQAKCEYLTKQLHFDASVNYRDASFKELLQGACPNGVDVYFDNVGGDVSDVVLRMINRGARIAVCGQIAHYNEEKPHISTPIPSLLLINSAMMQGFTVGNYATRFEEGIAALATWLAQGKLKYEETITNGFDYVIDSFLMLFKGENTGKLLVKVND